MIRIPRVLVVQCEEMSVGLLLFSIESGGVGAVVRSLSSDPKVLGSIPGSAESGIFGDLLSR